VRGPESVRVRWWPPAKAAWTSAIEVNDVADRLGSWEIERMIPALWGSRRGRGTVEPDDVEVDAEVEGDE